MEHVDDCEEISDLSESIEQVFHQDYNGLIGENVDVVAVNQRRKEFSAAFWVTYNPIDS